ncbi:hypothetical protein EDS67_04470 [candidate division KSB1 bacterium]|nr:MAG: hypothetical protein EDS67_04470 [candidate division KSB1 bacterium]MBC6951692.1 hypothetical protein [candidate division KSB1 bacterium]MCE7940640.1 hypothetical protein [Chlorobi bacterium CHB1]
MSTPDEEVGKKIIEQFRKLKLLSENKLEKLFPELVVGKLKPEDWKFAFETDRTIGEVENVSKNK